MMNVDSAWAARLTEFTYSVTRYLGLILKCFGKYIEAKIPVVIYLVDVAGGLLTSVQRCLEYFSTFTVFATVCIRQLY
jgi:hypothetical protein